MIPYQLLADRRNIENLMQYLVTDLQRVRADRAGLEQDWMRYQVKYRAKPENQQRTFPWPGAANLEIPVIATDVDTTVAGLMGVLYASSNLWSCVAQRPDWMEFAARLQEALEWAQETELGMYTVLSDWLPELVKLGTGILKWRYLREQKKVFEWRELPNMTVAQMVRRMTANRPDVKRVALADFYLPATAREILEAPWVAERIQLTWNQLEARVRAGIYTPDILDRIGYWHRQAQPITEYNQYQSVQERLDNFIPGIGDKFELFEFWPTYDINRDGEPEALVCTIHIPTMTYARIDFNPFFSQEPPFAAARFIRQEGRFLGIGLCEILEHFQEEVSAMHRQRIDNGTIRNAAVFKGRRGSGVRSDEGIWPGRTILMDDPATDLVPMSMGVPAESTIDDEQFTLQYARMRSGIGDYQRGGAGNPAISYSTATTTVEMLRQGRLRLDHVLREIHGCLGAVGRGVTELYQQFDQGGKFYKVLGQRDGTYVDAVLHFPLDLLRMGVSIKVTATSAQLNKEVEARTNQLVYGMVMNFYQQSLQTLMYALNPQLPPQMQMVAMAAFQGSCVLARRTLDQYGIQDADKIIPDFFGGGNAPGPSIGPESFYGGAPMGQGPGGPSGMAAGLLGPGGANGPGYGASPVLNGPPPSGAMPGQLY